MEGKGVIKGVEPKASGLERVRFFCQIAEEKKVTDIVVLYVGPATPITDYFVIGTCENTIHLDAVCDEMERRTKKELSEVARRSGTAESRWVLLDADSVIVHLFTSDLREFYDLEGLWGMAERWRFEEGQLVPAEAVPS